MAQTAKLLNGLKLVFYSSSEFVPT